MLRGDLSETTSVLITKAMRSMRSEGKRCARSTNGMLVAMDALTSARRTLTLCSKDSTGVEEESYFPPVMNTTVYDARKPTLLSYFLDHTFNFIL